VTRHLYELSLTERELLDIIQALRTIAEGSLAAAKERRRNLANRIEATLWLPYHQSVAAGRNSMRKG